MYASDAIHPNKNLQKKLAALFSLRKGSKINWDLQEYINFLEEMGGDHHHLPPVIHVAGTNGKGSIVATLKSILETQGYKVHAYTSPHLVRVNERIYLAGEYISDQELEELIDVFWPLAQKKCLSFFEIMTAIAFRAFSKKFADVLLLEVGCGGRLDCTNVISDPMACVISRISYDHTEYLGNTLAQIAAEKAGIMKAGVPCIIGYQGDQDASMQIFQSLENMAQQKNARALFFGKDWSCQGIDNYMDFGYRGELSKRFPLPNLVGLHQIWNSGAVLAVLYALQDRLYVSEESIRKGVQAINWSARMQKLPENSMGDFPEAEIWLDAGHNDSAGETLASQLRLWEEQDRKPVHLILGMLGSKDIRAFLAPLVPFVQTIHVVPVSGEKNCKTINDIFMDFVDPAIQEKVFQASTVEDAMITIKELSRGRCLRILICGSCYLAGEILSSVQNGAKM